MTCSKCGDDIQQGSWPFCHGEPGKHEIVRLGFIVGNAKRFDPVVVFRNKRGQIVVPGSSHERAPAGYERVEATDTHNVRAIERAMRTQTIAEKERSMEQKERTREMLGTPSSETLAKQARARLTTKMQEFSPAGKAFAEHTMKRMDEKRARKYNKPTYDPGGGFEAFNQDRSNRVEYNDPGTGAKDRG